MGRKSPQLTRATLKVLGTLLSSRGQEMSGAEIGRTTLLASGTLYPILLRLEEAQWVESRWETESPQSLGHPRRRFYMLTGLGEKEATAAFQDIVFDLRGVAWQS
jgi:PadR family transcriptional regulator, regulatory protein PadR